MASQCEFRFHITGPDLERDFIVPIGETLIGREPSSALPLIYPLVSRRHARLECSETNCTITDLESANGTLVNGERIEPNQPLALEDQTKITIGPFEIVVSKTEIAPVEEVPQEAPPPADEAEISEVGEEVPEPVKAKPAEKPSRQVKAQAEGGEPVKKPAKKPAETPPAIPPPEEPSEGEPFIEHLPQHQPVPGLNLHSQRLIQYLPGIYATDFMSRFLGMFETILTPIEWNVDNFDLFLDPGTTPTAFLPWLANWYQIVFNPTWTETQRRTLLREAYQIYARRGTRWALRRLLEIYTGAEPEIVEFSDPKDPFTFIIRLPIRERDVNRQLLEQLIDTNKPSQTSYALEFRG
jgi:phage tail-like protein